MGRTLSKKFAARDTDADFVQGSWPAKPAQGMFGASGTVKRPWKAHVGMRGGRSNAECAKAPPARCSRRELRDCSLAVLTAGLFYK